MVIRRSGAIAAIIGAVLSVAAGAGFGDVEGLGEPRAMLDVLWQASAGEHLVALG